MKKKYSNEIVEIIKEFLTEEDWKFFFDPEKGAFHFGLKIDGKMKDIKYLIHVRETEFTAYAFSPVYADDEDADCMARMSEFITRANYGLRNGNWEMDYDDGEIRYKSYVDAEGITLTTEAVKNSIYCIADMFERYSDGILSIIFGNATAEEAVKKCENHVSISNIDEILDKLGIDLETESPESAAEKIKAYLDDAIENEDEQTSENTEDEMTTDIKTTLFDDEE